MLKNAKSSPARAGVCAYMNRARDSLISFYLESFVPVGSFYCTVVSMARPKFCPDCQKLWKRSLSRAKIRSLWKKIRNGAEMLDFYPSWVQHSESTRCCRKHHVARTASAARRRATKAHATPAWCDHGAIQAIYAEAARITSETGIQMHVDHRLPLRGNRVTGFHVASNLQILPAPENIKKSNKFNPDCS